MTPDDNKKLVRRFYAEVVDTGNVDLVERFVSPVYAEANDGRREVVGVAGWKAHVGSACDRPAGAWRSPASTWTASSTAGSSSTGAANLFGPLLQIGAIRVVGTDQENRPTPQRSR